MMERKKFTCASLESRFWPKVKFDDSGCWLWTASVGGPGYGQISFGGAPTTVHRLIWQLYFGTIPNGLCVLHRCDVRRCCNPDHLFAGTPSDNTNDMISKGRQRCPGPKNPCRGERHGLAKLTKKQVMEIRERFSLGGVTQLQLGAEYGVSGPHISGIITGRFWKEDVQTLQDTACK